MSIKNLTLLFTYMHFLRRCPLLILALLKGFAQGLLLRRHTLRMMEFQLTFKCNSKCIMCSAADFTHREDETMSLDEMKNVWRQAQAMGASMVTLTGGEPTLRPDILEIIRMLSPNRTLISLTSNSLGLTDQFLLKLKQAGLHSLGISLDGITAEENDAIRGVPGHFEKAVSATKYAVSIGINVTISHTINSENIVTMDEFRKFAEGLGAHYAPLLTVPIGRAYDSTKLLSQANIETFEAFRKKHKLRIDYSLNYFLTNMCDAGWEKLCVSPYGDVIGCNLVHISVGNVMKEPLKKIRQRMLRHPLYNRSYPGCPGAMDTELMQPYYLAHLRDFDQYPPTIEQLDSLIKEKYPEIASSVASFWR